MELLFYLQVLWRRKWMILITTVVTFGIITLGLQKIPPTYASSARLRITSVKSGSSGFMVSDLNYSDRMMNTYMEIAKSSPIMELLMERLDIDEVPSVTVEHLTGTEIVTISAEAETAELTQGLANGMAELIVEKFDEMFIRSERLGAEGAGTELTPISEAFILDDAYLPSEPSGPNKKLFMALGAAVGLVGGVGLALVYENLDTKLHSTRQIEKVTALTVLGEIPNARGKQDGFLINHFIHAEAFRLLRANLFPTDATGNRQTLLITSAAPETGKSTVTANLAVSIAQTGRKVAAIDADLRRPTLHEHFGVSNAVGLSTVLEHDLPLAEALQKSHGVYVLASGPSANDSVERLGTERMPALLHQLTQQFDTVLIDAPACLAVADATVLAPAVDSVLLVTRHGRARADTLGAVLDEMAKINGKLAGLVVNRAPPGIKQRYARRYRPRIDKPPKAAALPAGGDPLAEINGIGDIYQKALHAAGIHTFADLAAQTPEALAQHIKARGVTARRIREDGWIEQAQARIQPNEQEQ